MPAASTLGAAVSSGDDADMPPSAKRIAVYPASSPERPPASDVTATPLRAAATGDNGDTCSLASVLSGAGHAFIVRGDGQRWVMRVLNPIISDQALLCGMCQHVLQRSLDVVVYALCHCRELPIAVLNTLALVMGADAKFMRYYADYGREADAKHLIGQAWAVRPPPPAPLPMKEPELAVSVHLVDNVNYFGAAGGYINPPPSPSP